MAMGPLKPVPLMVNMQNNQNGISKTYANGQYQRGKKNQPEERQLLLKFPVTKAILWNRTQTGQVMTISLAKQRKIRMYISEKTLLLASRHGQTKNCAMQGFLIGDLIPDTEDGMVEIQVDRFDPGRTIQIQTEGGLINRKVPTAIVPGDHTISLLLNSRDQKYVLGSLSSTNEFLQSIEVLSNRCSQKNLVNVPDLFMSHASFHCQTDVDELIVNFQCNTVTFSTEFIAKPINAVPIIPTALAKNLSGPVRLSHVQGNAKFGYLTMDQTRKLLVLLETDPKVETLPLVGIWVSGVMDVCHAYIWACCLKFLHADYIKERVLAPPSSFLLVHYPTTKAYPDFYECCAKAVEGGNTPFCLLSCQEQFVLNMKPGTCDAVCFDLCAANDGDFSVFHEAYLQWLNKRQPQEFQDFSKENTTAIAPNNSKAPNSANQQNNEEDESMPTPRQIPKPHARSNLLHPATPSVPELSFLEPRSNEILTNKPYNPRMYQENASRYEDLAFETAARSTSTKASGDRNVKDNKCLSAKTIHEQMRNEIEEREMPRVNSRIFAGNISGRRESEGRSEVEDQNGPHMRTLEDTSARTERILGFSDTVDKAKTLSSGEFESEPKKYLEGKRISVEGNLPGLNQTRDDSLDVSFESLHGMVGKDTDKHGETKNPVPHQQQQQQKQQPYEWQQQQQLQRQQVKNQQQQQLKQQQHEWHQQQQQPQRQQVKNPQQQQHELHQQQQQPQRQQVKNQQQQQLKQQQHEWHQQQQQPQRQQVKNPQQQQHELHQQQQQPQRQQVKNQQQQQLQQQQHKWHQQQQQQRQKLERHQQQLPQQQQLERHQQQPQQQQNERHNQQPQEQRPSPKEPDPLSLIAAHEQQLFELQEQIQMLLEQKRQEDLSNDEIRKSENRAISQKNTSVQCSFSEQTKPEMASISVNTGESLMMLTSPPKTNVRQDGRGCRCCCKCESSRKSKSPKSPKPGDQYPRTGFSPGTTRKSTGNVENNSFANETCSLSDLQAVDMSLRNFAENPCSTSMQSFASILEAVDVPVFEDSQNTGPASPNELELGESASMIASRQQHNQNQLDHFMPLGDEEQMGEDENGGTNESAEKEFYDTMMAEVKGLLTDQFEKMAGNELPIAETSDSESDERSDVFTELEKHEQIEKATLEQLKILGAGQIGDLETIASRGANLGTANGAMPFHPRINYVSMLASEAADDGNDIADAIAMKYLTSKQLSDVKYNFQEHRTKTVKFEGILEDAMATPKRGINYVSMNFSCNMSIATRKYMQRYNLLDSENDRKTERKDKCKNITKNVREERIVNIDVHNGNEYCSSNILDLNKLKQLPKLT